VELGVLGVLASLVAYLPGLWLSSWALRGLADHQLVPSGSRLSTPLWVLAITVGAGLVGTTGILLGTVVGTAAMLGATKALTGAWQPYVPWPAPVLLVVVVAALCLATTVVSSALVLSQAKPARRR
jgi:hypothetical protein